MNVNKMWLGVGCVVVAICGAASFPAGELTIDGNMTVKTNLVVRGQLSSAALSLTNVTVMGQATIQNAVIQHLSPQGDLGMGPYTNRAAQ